MPMSETVSVRGVPPAEKPQPLGTMPVWLLAIACVVTPMVLAYSLALGSEARVTAVVLGIVALVGVIARPFVGLLLFCVLLYIRPEETFPVLQGTRLTLAISVATAVGLALHLALNREPVVRSPISPMIIGFGLALVASTATLGNSSEAAMDAGRLVLLVLLVINSVRTPRKYQALISTVLACTGYLAVYSLYLYFTGKALLHGDLERSQASGIFGDPNDLAATITAGLALCLPRVISVRGGGRVLYGSLAVVCVWAILMTNSRGGMLALLAVVAGFSITFVRNKPLAVMVAVVVGGLFLVFGPSRMTHFDSTEASANMRFWYWSTGIEVLTNNPLLGIGYNQFVEINRGMTAHNSYVQCFAELGLAGYFFWMGCLYFAFRRRPQAEGAAVTPEFQRDLLGARLALTGFLVAAFFITRTYVPVLYLLIALPVAAQVATEQTGEALQEKAGAWLVDWGRIVLICLGSILFIKVFAEHYR
jgi:putative inorganic carbon (HCO3(-)) transporter